jgi:hypothetical protein
VRALPSFLLHPPLPLPDGLELRAVLRQASLGGRLFGLFARLF